MELSAAVERSFERVGMVSVVTVLEWWLRVPSSLFARFEDVGLRMLLSAEGFFEPCMWWYVDEGDGGSVDNE